MKKVISLDIGGTNTRVALINEKYKIEKVVINPTLLGNKDAFLSSVGATIDQCVGKDFKDVVAIAGGLPGRINMSGHIDALPNIGIEDVDLAEYLHKRFGLKTYIANDASVAALSEANVGPHKKYKSLYFITVSTGVGGALCIDGKLRRHSDEIGHTLFCSGHGNYHEFEHMVSGTYLPRLGKEDGIEVASAFDFFVGVKNKIDSLMPTYWNWLDLFARFIKSIQDAFQPEVFVLTGGVMKSADVFWDDLRQRCPESNLQKCHFSQEAGLIGAAVYGFQNA
ncbi:MAG: ROK family protein [Bacillota bacterium]|nr:ROK family protein [Bacillota bacterium]